MKCLVWGRQVSPSSAPSNGGQFAFDFQYSREEPLGHVDMYTPQFKNNYFTEMCSGSEAGSYVRRIDFCITQL